MSRTYIDVTEFIRSPVRTGIQRVVREILTHWPTDRELVAVEFDDATGELIEVDPVALAFARDQDEAASLGRQALQARMAARRRDGRQCRLAETPIVVPELFFDADHCRYYRERSVRSAFIVYDFLPWLYPDLLNFSHSASLNPFMLNIIRAERRCFISESVRHDFISRIAHRSLSEDQAISLGADGLGLARGAAVRVRGEHFLCFGFIDGRKKQQVVLDAFLQSRACRSHRLVFAGGVPEHPPERIRPVLECRHPAVSIVQDPTDTQLAELVRTARAVIFVSDLEGYGLPATEALFAGVPLVANAGLPALLGLSKAGQIRIETTEAASVRDALDRLCDDEEAIRLRRATRELELKTWAEYGRQVANWAAF